MRRLRPDSNRNNGTFQPVRLCGTFGKHCSGASISINKNVPAARNDEQVGMLIDVIDFLFGEPTLPDLEKIDWPWSERNPELRLDRPTNRHIAAI